MSYAKPAKKAPRRKTVKVDAPADLFEKEVKKIGDYQVLEILGKGGFGHVYRGVNVKTGTIVAIKRIKLIGIKKDDLAAIESEVDLLKNLAHPNIVQYIDAIKEEEALNIILEYVENTLIYMVQKFEGNLPESLCRLYIYQVLKGLSYLHQQGVIHRDIKGANILSTKNGIVKLADFGVASKIQEGKKSDSVVGTPYWMAPEIIEMSGAQTATCDIWSVGCTVIELLTGKPPYFDLQQMPAMFRIVQDEHPPLPDEISPALKDFLLQCFAKNPYHRATANQLLRHPWLKDVSISEDESELKRVTEIEEKKEKGLSEADIDKELAHLDDDLSIEEIEKELAEESLDVTVAPQALRPLPATPAAHKEKESAASFASALSENDLDDMRDDDRDLGGLDASSRGAGALQSSPSMLKMVASSLDDHGQASSSPSTRLKLIKSPKKLVEQVESPRLLTAFEEKDGGDFDIEIDENFDPSAALEKQKSQEKEDIDNIDELFDEIAFEAVEDSEAKVARQFNKILADFDPDIVHNEEEKLYTAIENLTTLMNDPTTAEPARRLLTAQNGLAIAIMELIEIENTNTLYAILKLISLLFSISPKFQQAMALVGLLPAVIRFSGKKNQPEIRIEAANIIRHFCYNSDYTRKIFIACGGLPTLVSFLQEDYRSIKALVFNAIDCIRHVFDITTSPKNHFLRLFCKFGLLVPLAKTFVKICGEKSNAEALEYVTKVADIFFLFSTGDQVVRLSLANPSVVSDLLEPVSTLSPPVALLILKTIRNLAMDPATLDLLEQAGAIPALVPFLNSSFAEQQNQVLACLYDLCKIKSSRQDQAAAAGIIPPLQRIIQSGLTIRQFAFPLVFLLANSKRSRMELKKYRGVQFFLDLLSDPYWRLQSLEAITDWLLSDLPRVSFTLCKPTNTNKLITLFRTTESIHIFEKLLPLFAKMLQTSIRLNQQLGRSAVFLEDIKNRLAYHASSNAIRISLLRILHLLLVAHKTPKQVIKQHKLNVLIKELSEDKASVLVMDLANKLLKKYT